jgi:hypothetical protein
LAPLNRSGWIFSGGTTLTSSFCAKRKYPSIASAATSATSGYCSGYEAEGWIETFYNLVEVERLKTSRGSAGDSVFSSPFQYLKFKKRIVLCLARLLVS